MYETLGVIWNSTAVKMNDLHVYVVTCKAILHAAFSLILYPQTMKKAPLLFWLQPSRLIQNVSDTITVSNHANAHIRYCNITALDGVLLDWLNNQRMLCPI